MVELWVQVLTSAISFMCLGLASWHNEMVYHGFSRFHRSQSLSLNLHVYRLADAEVEGLVYHVCFCMCVVLCGQGCNYLVFVAFQPAK